MHPTATIPAQANKPKRGTINPQPLHVAQIPEALLKVQTVAAVTGLSVSTIFRKVAAGEFPQPARLGKRCSRWKAGSVTAWLASQGGE